MPGFVELIPNPDDLLSLDVEELAVVVMEVARDHLRQQGHIYWTVIVETAFPRFGPSYPTEYRNRIHLAVAEAIAWLKSQGLFMPDPDQAAGYIRLTRRGASVRDRADFDAYRSARALPAELVQPTLMSRVRPIFLRGDYDVAVFQAFKSVEVHVRTAANSKGAGYSDNDLGVDLMRHAFHPDRGPLTDRQAIPAEREAVSALFAGAIGHAKNPSGHREVAMTAKRAARLIVFASHLMDLVDERLS